MVLLAIPINLILIQFKMQLKVPDKQRKDGRKENVLHIKGIQEKM